jgi:hypothetical protein
MLVGQLDDREAGRARDLARASASPWRNSAPSSMGNGHSGSRTVRTRPPMRVRASSTATERPAWESVRAAARPAAPAPITTASNSAWRAPTVSYNRLPVTDRGSPLLGERFERALQHATRLHAAQTRKGTNIPYVSHLLSVAAIVLEDGGDEDEAIAALLHDAVEDQGGRPTLEEIRSLFGDRVAEIVEGCSDTDVVPKPPWRRRKEIYIEHIRTARPEVLRVSAADKLHNARAILADFRRHGDALWPRFSGAREGTLWYYRTLIAAYRAAGGAGFLVDELDRTVTELERLAVRS